MLVEAFLTAWLTAQQSSQDCFVVGEVSAREEDGLKLEATGCPIKIERKGKIITLTSPKYIVEITIPDTSGTQQFLYQWGQSQAKFGNQTIEIAFHPVSGG